MSEQELVLQNDYVIFIDKLNNTGWGNARLRSECSDGELKQANLCRLNVDEVVLDLEDKTQLPTIADELVKSKAQFELWDTGSRGYHIHMIFPQLKDYEEETRNKIRLFIIKQFKTDEKMASEKQWIAAKNKPHFKTGKIKTLINCHDGKNYFSQEFIENALKKQEYITQDNVGFSDEEFKNWHKTDKLFLYYCKNNIPEGQSKNNTLHKNFAIALVKEGLNDGQIVELMEPQLLKYGHNINEFLGWVGKARCGEIKEYSTKELNKWIRQFNHNVELYSVFDNEVEKSFDSMFRGVNPDNKYLPAKLATFYHIAGEMLLENPIQIYDADMRFSFGLCVKSGLGKSAIKKVIVDSAALSGKTCAELVSLHEEQLVGKRWTQKKSKNSEEKEIERKGHLNEDFLIKDDALTFINDPKYEIARNYTLAGLDIYGRNTISKKLTESENALKYLARCSLVYFIQPSEKVAIRNVNSGFIRRAPILRVDFTVEDRKQILTERLKKAYNPKPEKWIEFLKFLSLMGKRGLRYMPIDDCLIDMINEESNKYLTDSVLLDTMDTTNQNNIIKFSYINALLRSFLNKPTPLTPETPLTELEVRVELEDVLAGMGNYGIIYSSIQKFVDDNRHKSLHPNKMAIIEYLKKQGAYSLETGISRKKLEKELVDNTKVVWKTLRDHYHNLKEEGLICTKKEQYDAKVWIGEDI